MRPLLTWKAVPSNDKASMHTFVARDYHAACRRLDHVGQRGVEYEIWQVRHEGETKVTIPCGRYAV